MYVRQPVDVSCASVVRKLARKGSAQAKSLNEESVHVTDSSATVTASNILAAFKVMSFNWCQCFIT